MLVSSSEGRQVILLPGNQNRKPCAITNIWLGAKQNLELAWFTNISSFTCSLGKNSPKYLYQQVTYSAWNVIWKQLWAAAYRYIVVLQGQTSFLVQALNLLLAV